jgi:hypothetical protein
MVLRRRIPGAATCLEDLSACMADSELPAVQQLVVTYIQLVLAKTCMVESTQLLFSDCQVTCERACTIDGT